MEFLLTILTTVITVLASKPVLDELRNRRQKRIEAVHKSHPIFNQEAEFFKNFVTCDLNEAYFAQQTGISVNETSINKLISFKESLGGYYTWKHIRKVMPHLNLFGKKATINLDWMKIWYANLVIFFGLLCLALTGYIYINIISIEIENWKNFLIMYSVTFMPLVLTLFAVNSADTIWTAKAMKKRIKSL